MEGTRWWAAWGVPVPVGTTGSTRRVSQVEKGVWVGPVLGGPVPYQLRPVPLEELGQCTSANTWCTRAGDPQSPAYALRGPVKNHVRPVNLRCTGAVTRVRPCNCTDCEGSRGHSNTETLYRQLPFIY